jgi:hypothetical protein
LLDSTREGTSQRGYLESYSYPLNVEHLEREIVVFSRIVRQTCSF